MQINNGNFLSDFHHDQHCCYSSLLVQPHYNCIIKIIKNGDLIKPKYIHANNEEAFRWSCYYVHLEVAKWLCTLCDDYYLKYDGKNIISYSSENIIKNLKK